MKRLLLLVTLLLALALGSTASAGQAACRFELPAFGFVCYGEHTVASFYNFEVATGAEIAYKDEFSFTPFGSIAWYDDAWFVVLETRLTTMFAVRPAFNVALTVGATW